MDYTGGKCPEPIKNKELNKKNHLICIAEANLGPPNPTLTEPVFWLMKSIKWNVSESAAREMVCGNCGHYWKTKFIDECMKLNKLTPPDVDPEWVNTGDGGGYCDEFEITCTRTRTCDDWEPGGPITDAVAKAGRLDDDEEE